MARISATTPASSSSGKKIPVRPSWLMDDFCDHLGKTYDCSRKTFHTKLPPAKKPKAKQCGELFMLLNLFELAGSQPTKQKDPLEAKLSKKAGGSGSAIEVKENEIKSKAVLNNCNTAIEMALLAMGNPTMTGGVTLDGNAHELKLLSLACAHAGIKVDNPAVIDPKRDAKLIKDMDAAWEKLHTKAHARHVAQVARNEHTFRSNMVNNSVAPNVKKLLGSVTDADYQKAKDGIWTSQTITQKQLMNAFGFSAGAARNVMEAMKEEDFIYQPGGKGGRYKVCVDKDCRWVPA